MPLEDLASARPSVLHLPGDNERSNGRHEPSPTGGEAHDRYRCLVAPVGPRFADSPFLPVPAPNVRGPLHRAADREVFVLWGEGDGVKLGVRARELTDLSGSRPGHVPEADTALHAASGQKA